MNCKKVLTKEKDDYLHDMLFDIYYSSEFGDETYIEIFKKRILVEDLSFCIKTEYLLYSSDDIFFFKDYLKCEENKVNYYNRFDGNWAIYPMHYLVFIMLNKLYMHYTPNYFSDGCMHQNKNSFKRIKIKYQEMMSNIRLVMDIEKITFDELFLLLEKVSIDVIVNHHKNFKVKGWIPLRQKYLK